MSLSEARDSIRTIMNWPAQGDAVTENPPTTIQRWQNVMAEVSSLGKNERAQAGNTRFNFRGIDAVMNAVGPALRKHGVVIIPRVVDVQREEHTSKAGGRMVGTIVHVEYGIYGGGADTDVVIIGSAYGEASDSGDKSVPKAMSVAYRTFLLQALCLPTDEPDPDTHIYERAAPERAAPAKPAGEPLSSEQAVEILELFDTLGLEENDQRAGILRYTERDTTVGDLTAEEAERVLVPLRRTVQNRRAAPTGESAESLVSRALGGTPVGEEGAGAESP